MQIQTERRRAATLCNQLNPECGCTRAHHVVFSGRDNICVASESASFRFLVVKGHGIVSRITTSERAGEKGDQETEREKERRKRVQKREKVVTLCTASAVHIVYTPTPGGSRIVELIC